MTSTFRSWTLVAAAFCGLAMFAPPMAASAATTPPTPAERGDADATAIQPEEFELKPRTVAFATGGGKWDDAEAILDKAFKSIYSALLRQNVHTVGVPMVEYMDSDDATFSFRAMVPVDAAPGTTLGPAAQIGESPSGKVLKFVHRGPLEDLEQVYNRIDDYLASKDLSMARVIEEYVTDQAITPPNGMITTIYVFTQ